MREFFVDCNCVNSLDAFKEAFNEGFCRHVGSELKQLNLDALNDCLCWPQEDYRITFVGWAKCVDVLSVIHMPSGKTYLDNLTEIFRENPYGTTEFA